MKNFYCNYLIFVFLISCNTVISSKLNLVVLRSSDDIFKEANSAELNGSEKIISYWENESFIVANATQISNSLGDTVNGSTKFILATKSAFLTTRIKDFGHTFLSIKFSSIIGRSVSDPEPSSTTEEDSQQEPDEISTESSSDLSTTVSPISTTANPNPIQQQLATSTTTKKSTIAPAVLKLNTDNKYGADILHIALAPPEPKINPVTIAPKLEEIETSPKSSRKKRTLNSEEIFQIHRIISKVSTNNDDDESNNKEGGINSNKGQGGVLSETEVGSEVPLEQTDDNNEEPKKLSYGIWRSSMDKSFRPPGFYITVDDKVIFDNWIGVWQNPGVMGRWVPPTRQKLWNETELLLEFSEDPDQDIKISFEWEPPLDMLSYVFLSNITISTYGPNTTHSKKSNHSANSTVITNITDGDGNKNITLYIVVKSHPELHSDPLSNTSSQTQSDNLNKSQIISNPILSLNNPAPKEISNKPKQPKSKESSQTALYVAITTGILSLLILITVIHKKLELSRRQSRGC